MSNEFTFGDEEPGGYEPGAGEPKPPKFFRDFMDKVSGQLNDLKAENDRLKGERRQIEVAETLRAQGYAPQAASLYQGDPKELNGWLEANKDALAKLPSGNEMVTPQAPSGPPATVVSPESQAALQRMQSAGAENIAPPAGSDKELAARIDSMNQEQFAEFMRSQGNRYYR